MHSGEKTSGTSLPIQFNSLCFEFRKNGNGMSWDQPTFHAFDDVLTFRLSDDNNCCDFSLRFEQTLTASQPAHIGLRAGIRARIKSNGSRNAEIT